MTDFKIKEIPNFLHLAHTPDGIMIDNISNPMRMKEIDNKTRFRRDFFLVLRSLNLLWLNRPDNFTPEEEQEIYRQIATTFEQINEN